MQRFIGYLYQLLFLLTPLLFLTSFSEAFELPKIAFIYGITTLIVTLWAIRMLIERKIIFSYTLLDIPLVIFLLSQIAATFFSIDLLTSIQGYYSRFYGGVLSLAAMELLYWAAVSNLNKENLRQITYALLLSGAVISLWAILEHFGYSASCLLMTGRLDVSCWTQRVQERPFATLGQPNWLAAYLSMLIPLTWTKLEARISQNEKYIYLLMSILMFLALLFTKSRAGLLGLLISFVVYWTFHAINSKLKINKLKLLFLLTACYLLTATIFNPLRIHTEENPDPTVTPSSNIRLLLWKGAIDIWEDHPFFGTGPETFAYSYYQVRPIEHNLTSEWNFVYNKAHNQYLDYLAGSGLIGFAAYLVLIIFSILQIFSFQPSKGLLNYKVQNYQLALFSGYLSLLISNIFGFTVTITGLLLFLYPAFAALENAKRSSYKKLIIPKYLYIFVIVVIFSASYYLLQTIYLFLQADYLYAKSDYIFVKRAVEISPYQPQYWEKLGTIYTQADSDILADKALTKTKELAPVNTKLQKSVGMQYLFLGKINDQYYLSALSILKPLEKAAPTDPMIPYFQALASLNLDKEAEAEAYINRALTLKPNYNEARDALELIEH